jgi:hypothetical protein
VVFGDVHALFREALTSDARTYDLGKSVDVEGNYSEPGFDLGAHGLGPELGTEDSDFERE